MDDKSQTITLVMPIRRGKETIDAVTLDKPSVGALRGLKLTNVLQMDVSAMLVLLPRITRPALTPDEVAGLDPADLLSCAGQVVSFFMTAEQMAQAQAEARLP